MTFKDELFSENKKYFSDNKQVSIVRKSDVAWLLRDINIYIHKIIEGTDVSINEALASSKIAVLFRLSVIDFDMWENLNDQVRKKQYINFNEIIQSL